MQSVRRQRAGKRIEALAKPAVDEEAIADGWLAVDHSPLVFQALASMHAGIERLDLPDGCPPDQLSLGEPQLACAPLFAARLGMSSFRRTLVYRQLVDPGADPLAKGNYFALAQRAPFTRLVYPLPEAAGLGVHYTRDLSGAGRLGPDVQWIDLADRGAEDYRVDAARAAPFAAAIRRYWPALPDDALQPAYAGIRPKISGPGQPAADFMIQGPAEHGVPGLVNLLGIESPGLTAALAIAEQVAGMLQR